MDKEQNFVAVDAQSSFNNTEILSNQIKSLQLNSILDDLTVNECKSMLFLLMDFIGEHEFLKVTKQEETYLKKKLEEILKKINDDSIFIELLGTLKMYKKLKTLDTCYHVYEKLHHKKFNNIKVWKMFYLLCEELTEDDLEMLKQHFYPYEQIETAEEWFCIALQKNLISITDFSNLEKIFHNYQNCLNIIKSYEMPECYNTRTPAADTHCGIAVILNFEVFKELYKQREGSDVDVKSLEEVWNMFGFKTEVYNNLTYTETLNILKNYANLDHSNYDAFVCCILSHGRSNSVISSDDEEMPIPRLIGEITNKCSSLDSKPKLFFIQACQGINIQQGFGKPVYKLQSTDVSETTTDLYVPPIASDVLLAISSIDGFVSFRNKETGSWFIQEFCSVMKQKGDKFSILDVMIEVNSNVRKKHVDFGPGKPRSAQQIVNCYNSFGKILILKKKIR